MFCQSGEISPDLVTLVGNPLFGNCLNVRFESDVFAFLLKTQNAIICLTFTFRYKLTSFLIKGLSLQNNFNVAEIAFLRQNSAQKTQVCTNPDAINWFLIAFRHDNQLVNLLF